MTKTFEDIANKLAQDAELIARYLLPNGERQGQEWHVGSLNGEKGNSLKVHLAHPKAGVWCDFATGQGGDLLELWRQVRNLSVHEAMAEAKNWLGIKYSSPSFTQLRQKLPQIFARPKNQAMKLALNSQVATYLQTERKLTVDTLNKYQIGEYKRKDKDAQKDRDVMLFPYIRNDQIIMYKHIFLDRPIGKKEMFTTKDAEPCLFGWNMVSPAARSVAIFEGEIDTMTAYQYGITRFNTETKLTEPIGVLSVPLGGGAGNKQAWVEYEFERLVCYDEIYIVMDVDSVGQDAVTELIARLGRHRCLVVTLPYKDMNECLQKRIDKAVVQKCFDDAKNLDPEELVSIGKYTPQIKELFSINNNLNQESISGASPALIGYLPPWDIKNSDLRFRPSELSVWTGINGHGKSQLLGQVVLHCITQGAKACIASLEMKPHKLGERLYRQISGSRCPSKENIDAIAGYLEKKLFLFDYLGTANVDKLLETFKYAHCRYGVDVFVIDSLMKCGLSEDDYPQQKLFMDKLCDFKNEYNCHIHLVAHPRKGDNEYTPPGKMDIKGSGAITDLADNCFNVWRNVAKEEKLQEPNLTIHERQNQTNMPDSILACYKQRNGEWNNDKILLRFDKESFQYLCLGEQQVLPMVDFYDAKIETEEEEEKEIDYEYGIIK